MQEAQPRCPLSSTVEPAWVACAWRLLEFWAWKLDQEFCWGGYSSSELLACPVSVLVGIQEFQGMVGVRRIMCVETIQNERVRVSSLKQGPMIHQA